MKKLLILLLLVGSLKAMYTNKLYTPAGSLNVLPKDAIRGLSKELGCICLSRDVWMQKPEQNKNSPTLNQLFMGNKPTGISLTTIEHYPMKSYSPSAPSAQEQSNVQFASEARSTREILITLSTNEPPIMCVIQKPLQK
jgi:hypothetical protein